MRYLFTGVTEDDPDWYTLDEFLASRGVGFWARGVISLLVGDLSIRTKSRYNHLQPVLEFEAENDDQAASIVSSYRRGDPIYHVRLWKKTNEF